MRFMLVLLLSVSGCVCFVPADEFDFDGGAGGGAATGGGSATGGGAAVTGGGAATGGGVATGGGSPTGDAGTVEHQLYAVGVPDCAPNDGAAVHMYLSFSELDCPVPSSEGLIVDVWADELQTGTYTLSTPGYQDDGTACECGVVANNVQSGTLQFDSADGGTAEGRVDLTFQQGGEVHGPLHVKMCPGSRQCG